jgi:fructose-bisphosphate aldolase, class I
MYDRIHEMRTRIITSPAFDGDRIIGAILFENTMDREIEGRGTPSTCGRQAGRAVPEGGQGLADGGGRRAADEADPGLDACSRARARRACSARRCAR